MSPLVIAIAAALLVVAAHIALFWCFLGRKSHRDDENLAMTNPGN